MDHSEAQKTWQTVKTEDSVYGQYWKEQHYYKHQRKQYSIFQINVFKSMIPKARKNEKENFTKIQIYSRSSHQSVKQENGI